MKNPKDFPKGTNQLCFDEVQLTCPKIALWAVTIAEVVVFTLCGALMYHFVGTFVTIPTRVQISLKMRLRSGNQYMTAPAFGSLQPVYKKIAFSFAIPTIIFLGSLYSVPTYPIITPIHERS